MVSPRFIKLTGEPVFFKKGALVIMAKISDKENLVCIPNYEEKNVVINYRLDRDAVSNLQIYDVNKREYIKLFDNQPVTQGMHQRQVNTEGYEKGLYIVQLAVGKQLFTKKFLIPK